MIVAFLKKYLLAPIDVIYEKLIDLPIVFFSLLLLLIRFSWQTSVVLVLAITGFILWDYHYVTIRYNCRQYTGLLSYLEQYSHCDFQCHKLEEVLAEKYQIHESFLDIFRAGWNSIAFNNQIRRSDLGWLCVVKRKKPGAPAPYIPKAFLCSDSPSYIMTSDSPDASNLMQQKLLYIISCPDLMF